MENNEAWLDPPLKRLGAQWLAYRWSSNNWSSSSLTCTPTLTTLRSKGHYRCSLYWLHDFSSKGPLSLPVTTHVSLDHIPEPRSLAVGLFPCHQLKEKLWLGIGSVHLPLDWVLCWIAACGAAGRIPGLCWCPLPMEGWCLPLQPEHRAFFWQSLLTWHRQMKQHLVFICARLLPSPLHTSQMHSVDCRIHTEIKCHWELSRWWELELVTLATIFLVSISCMNPCKMNSWSQLSSPILLQIISCSSLVELYKFQNQYLHQWLDG